MFHKHKYVELIETKEYPPRFGPDRVIKSLRADDGATAQHFLNMWKGTRVDLVRCRCGKIKQLVCHI